MLNCRFTLTQTTEPLIENFREFKFYTQLAGKWVYILDDYGLWLNRYIVIYHFFLHITAPEPPQKPDVVKSGIEGRLFTIELHNTTTRNGPIGYVNYY